MRRGNAQLASRPRGESGQAMVEMAIVVALCTMLLTGVIEFGRTQSAAGALNGAVREGVRLAAVTSADKRSQLVQSQVESAAAAYFRPSNLTVKITNSNAGGQPLVTVTATGQLETLFGEWFGLGKTFVISRDATMRDETVMGL
jgi:Flp pilus assembly protein TadG